MARKYRHISSYEREIIEMFNNGITLREIGEKLGFTLKEIKDFKYRYNKKQRMIEAGKRITQRGRPCKNKANELPPSIQRLDKLAQMRYVLASKERYIKRLEMENELMRDFLLLTEMK